jgi:hypothetical protein
VSDDPVYIDTIWRHRNGCEYIVEQFANTENPGRPKYPLTVIYRNTMNGKLYARPMSDWHRSMTQVNTQERNDDL